MQKIYMLICLYDQFLDGLYASWLFCNIDKDYRHLFRKNRRATSVCFYGKGVITRLKTLPTVAIPRRRGYRFGGDYVSANNVICREYIYNRV